MKKVIRTEIYQITELSNIWVVPVVQGKVFYEVCALYDENKRILDVPNTVAESFDTITINFGFDAHIGYVKYAWIEYVDEEESNTQGTQTVNVNVTNENTCGNCGDTEVLTSEFKTIILSSTKSFKVAEYGDNSIMIDYMLKCSDGEVESGRVVIINSNGVVRLDAERFMNSSLLDVSFLVNKDSSGINLTIQKDDSKTYEFKYKSLIF